MSCNCQTCNGLCPCQLNKVASRYFAAYNFRDLKALADAWAIKYPQLRERLLKALAFTGEVVQKGPTLYAIESENQTYNIKVDPTGGGGSTCTCADFANRQTKCKHILACALVFSASRGDVPIEPKTTPANASERSLVLDGKDYLVIFQPDPSNGKAKILYVQDEDTGIWMSKNELKLFINKYQRDVDEAYTDSLLPTELL